MSRTYITLAGRRIGLSNLDKVLYPETGFTKAQCIDYYRQIAPVLLPHLRGRPLTMQRFPDGVTVPSFYAKRCPPHRPDWMPTIPVASASHGTIQFCGIDDLPGLVWVANLAAIELHTLLFTSAAPDRPTMLVFDLDPGPPATLLDCIEIALHMRAMLNRLHLQSFPKTSGGNGLHFYVPLNTPASFARTKSFARAVAQVMERQFPDRVTSKMSKQQRPGKIFIDWSQNDAHKTTVAVYSLRARSRPTVSMPLHWDQLEAALASHNPGAVQFDPARALATVAQHGDMFAPVLTLQQQLPA